MKQRDIIMITTIWQRGNPHELNRQRISRIQEALNFERGNREYPIKHVISTIDRDVEVFFLKPGKEAFREINIRPNDMTPQVSDLFTGFSFEDIWKYLLKISIVRNSEFKQILKLIYRLAYHIDHLEIDNKIRYCPQDALLTYIENINNSIRTVYNDYRLKEFLHFLDLLGWNEDVKYHTQEKIGRAHV